MGGKLQMLQSLQGFQRGWIKSTGKRNEMLVGGLWHEVTATTYASGVTRLVK